VVALPQRRRPSHRPRCQLTIAAPLHPPPTMCHAPARCPRAQVTELFLREARVPTSPALLRRAPPAVAASAERHAELARADALALLAEPAHYGYYSPEIAQHALTEHALQLQ